MLSLATIILFGLLLAPTIAQENLAMRCGFLYYLPCLKPQLDRSGNDLFATDEIPQEDVIQRLHDFPYNPPSYTERKSHVKSFRPRMPLLRY